MRSGEQKNTWTTVHPGLVSTERPSISSSTEFFHISYFSLTWPSVHGKLVYSGSLYWTGDQRVQEITSGKENSNGQEFSRVREYTWGGLAYPT